MSTDKNYCIQLKECGCGDGAATLPDLSYEEQYAGFHDEDGNKVYVRSMNLGAAPSRDINNLSIPLGIPNVRSIISFEPSLTTPGGSVYLGNVYFSTTLNISFCVSPHMVWIVSKGNFQNDQYQMKIRIYYTCTDR